MTDHPDQRSHRFDTAMRGHHDVAVAQLSARTQAQLAQRRRAVLSAPRAASSLRRYGWAGATAFAAVLAVAVAMQWQPTTQVPVAPSTLAASDQDVADIDTLLDENPDFYLWLASNDAKTLAME